ncbi:MAG: hypothetical protein JSU87_05385 [Gemmatimonadota bacterium]|nr:MAG: hypothetical protein JSU87_05385 [Gemmatimonadota bacterium]
MLTPNPLGAQWLDARQPRRGALELGVSGLSVAAEERLLPDGSRQTLADALAVSLDPRLVPALDAIDPLLGAIYAGLGLSQPEGSTLGIVRYDVLLERTLARLGLELGITDWLALFTTVPIVKGQGFASTLVDSTSATMGPGEGGFGSDPTGFFAGLGAGIADLESMIAADTLPPEQQQLASELLAEARNLEAGLGDLSQLRYLPTDSSAAGRELAGVYRQLQEGFEAYELALPDLALAQPLSAEEAEALTSGDAFGIETPRDRSTGVKFGDIEVGVSLQPLNSFRRQGEESGPTLAIRTRLDALWRFGTGDYPAPGRLTDAGTGDGQNDLELRATFDVAVGRRLWLSLLAGYNLQMKSTQRRLITTPAAPIQLGAYETSISWDPGDVLTLAVAPRLNFSRHITVSLLYALQNHGRDSFTAVGGVPPDAAFQPADLEEGTEHTASWLGFSLRYSASDWARDRSERMPVEVELSHRKVIDASDGLVPRQVVWQVSLRMYRSIFR